MRGRRGQFYLLAAIVIVALIIGFAAISNYSKKKTDIRLIDLGEELGIEGGSVLEYGVYSEEDKIEEFSEEYSEYAGKGKDLFFIFGDKNVIYVLTYDEVSAGKICIGDLCDPQQTEEAFVYTITNPTDPFDIIINDIIYSFDLKEGENFYFVISQEAGGEQHVVQG